MNTSTTTDAGASADVRPGLASPSSSGTTTTDSAPQVWTGEIWNIHAATVDLGPALLVEKPTRFQLVPAQAGPSNAYSVGSVDSAALPPCFQGSGLVLRKLGAATLPALHGGPLPEFDDSSRSKYWDASHDVLSAANQKDLARLEARMVWDGAEHVILLYQVPGALRNGKSLLVIRIKQPDSLQSPDGWGVGNS